MICGARCLFGVGHSGVVMGADWLFAFAFLTLLPFGDSFPSVVGRGAVAFVVAWFLGGAWSMPTVSEGGEALVRGFVAALPLALTVSGAAMVGELIDGARGVTIGNAYDRTLEQQSVLGQLFHYAALGAIFASGAVLHQLVRGSTRDTAIAPLGVVDSALATMAHVAQLFLPVAILLFVAEALIALMAVQLPAVGQIGEAVLVKSAVVWVVLGVLIGTGELQPMLLALGGSNG